MSDLFALVPDFVMIDDFLIDASLEENYTWDSEVTDYPVEAGGSVSDNIRPKPITVSIKGVVSNTPLSKIAAARANSEYPGSESSPIGTYALSVLQAIRDNREPVTIRTSLNWFENMAMVSLTVPKSADLGDALHFTATFQQIQIVTNNRVRVKSAIPGGKGKRNHGPKPSDNIWITTLWWRKGAPPGSQDIYTTEVLGLEENRTTGKSQYVHRDIGQHKNEAGQLNDRGTPLSATELKAFYKDQGRDLANRALGRPEDPTANFDGNESYHGRSGETLLIPKSPTKKPTRGMSKIWRDRQNKSTDTSETTLIDKYMKPW